MHIHNVYFWLKNGQDKDVLKAFEQGLDSLTHDPRVKSGYFGKPATTNRDVVENTYSFGLVLVFDDLAAHDQYQAGAIHLEFVDKHSSKWERVIVHDIETR